MVRFLIPLQQLKVHGQPFQQATVTAIQDGVQDGHHIFKS